MRCANGGIESQFQSPRLVAAVAIESFGDLAGMRTILSLILLCAVCAVTGCSAIGSRVVGGRYFSGLRCDYAMCFDRSSIEQGSRIHPALAVVDMPFSFVGDILFLPYDACSGSRSSCRTNVVNASSHE